MKQCSRVPFGEMVMNVLAVVLLLLLPIPSASAHDVLTDTSPQDGQRLDAVPEAIELTFSNAPLAIGSEVLVLDAAGTNWATGTVQIVDNTARQPLRPETPAGEYTVTWRVVSSDSHVIEGTFGFTAEEAGATGVPSRAPTPQQSPPNPAEAAPSPPAGLEQQQAAPAGTEQGVSVVFLVVLGMLIVAFVGIIAVVFVLRRQTGTVNDQ